MEFHKINHDLARSLNAMKFGKPITHVYNPLDYARKPCDLYFKKYGHGHKHVIFLGMNPGPFGMAQTGVPFGEIAAVRDWMGIEAPVEKPESEHPKRPVDGFACPKSEVSGRRLWGWAQDRFGGPENFFKRAFVINYCPLAFMEASGRNFTPDKLPARERDPLFAECDRALRRFAEAMTPDYVIGVGAFAQKRAEIACAGLEGIRFGRILHPSPASPAANRGWAKQVDKELAAQGVNL